MARLDCNDTTNQNLLSPQSRGECRRYILITLIIILLINALSLKANDKASSATHDNPTRLKSFKMALKNNILSDLLLIPNIGAEFYFGKNISVGADYIYAWWSNKSAHRYWRINGFDVNARFWFGTSERQKPLTGHHIGIHAGMVTFDFELGGKGYMGGKPGHSSFCRPWWVVGAEYGYSLPMSRHLNIDFNIGVGCAGGKLSKYEPTAKGYTVKSNRQCIRLIPTKTEIALVWLLDYNFKKKN